MTPEEKAVVKAAVAWCGTSSEYGIKRSELITAVDALLDARVKKVKIILNGEKRTGQVIECKRETEPVADYDQAVPGPTYETIRILLDPPK